MRESAAFVGNQAGTLVRADIVALISAQTGLTQSRSASLVAELLDHLARALSAGERVMIASFGTFLVQHTDGRFGYDFARGASVMLGPRRRVTFRPSALLLTALNDM